MPSRRSMMPPWPGSRLDMSLMPSSRLNWLSTKSPMVPQMTRAMPSTMPIHHGPWMRKCTTSTPVMMPASMDPAKPSQDLLLSLIHI